MLIKRFRFFALFLSFALLIGHDVIPHAHFEDHDLECHDSHSDQHDADQADENFNLFSFVSHTGGFVSESVSQLTNFNIAVTAPFEMTLKSCTTAIKVPPKIPESAGNALPEPNFSCSSLRAPPYLFL